jgi:hypothetical protein
MNKKYMHKRVLVYSENEQDKVLEDMGNDGWELVAVAAKSNTDGDIYQYHLYFKKPNPFNP